MASFRIGVALTGTILTIFVLFQLLVTIKGQDQPLIFNTEPEEEHWAGSSTSDDGVFLLGAGKADITGYSSPFFPRLTCFC